MSFLEGLSHAFSHGSFLLYSIMKRVRGTFRRERALSLTPVEGTSNGPSLAIPHCYPLVKSYVYSIEALQSVSLRCGCCCWCSLPAFFSGGVFRVRQCSGEGERERGARLLWRRRRRTCKIPPSAGARAKLCMVRFRARLSSECESVVAYPT